MYILGMNALKFLILVFLLSASLYASEISVDQMAAQTEVMSQMSRGQAFHDKGLFDEALKCYFKADSIMPKVPLIQYEIAYAYLAKGDKQNAIVYGKRTLELDDMEQAYALMGDAFDGMKQLDSALKYYDAGLALFPKSNVILYNKSVALASRGMLRDAYEAVRHSAKFTHAHESTYFLAASLAYELRDLQNFEAFGLYALLISSNETRQRTLLRYFASLKGWNAAFAQKADRKVYDALTEACPIVIERLAQNSSVDMQYFYKSLEKDGFSEIFSRYAFQRFDPIYFESWKFINKKKTNEFRTWIAEFMRSK